MRTLAAGLSLSVSTHLKEKLLAVTADQVSLLRPIGHGSFSNIFEVELNLESKTISSLALKRFMTEEESKQTFPDKTYSEKDMQLLIDKETENLMKVKNLPGVLQLKGIVTAPIPTNPTKRKITGILTNLVNGETLFDVLANINSICPKIKDFSRQLLEIVQGYHHREVVHKDLKLENILLDEKEQVTVIDFGFSQFSKPDKYSGAYSHAGSPAYAAPELTLSDKQSSAIDMWAVGLILFTYSKRTYLHNYLNKYLTNPFSRYAFINRDIQTSQFTDEITIYDILEYIKTQNLNIEQNIKDLQTIIDAIVDDRIKDKDFADLIKQLLKLRPEERLSARQALSHPAVCKACFNTHPEKFSGCLPDLFPDLL